MYIYFFVFFFLWFCLGLERSCVTRKGKMGTGVCKSNFLVLLNTIQFMFIFFSFRIMGLRESDSRSNFTCALRKEINFRSRLSNFKEIFQSFLRLCDFWLFFLVETRQGQGNGDAGQNVAERGKTKTTQGDCAGTLLCTTCLCFTVFFISSLSAISVLGNYYY